MFSREFTRTIRIRVGKLSSWPAPPLNWTGHTGSVEGVSYSPNGARVVTVSSDKTIRIWDAESGTIVGEPLTGHTGGVNSVAHSPDGRRIISGSLDHTIRIWDAETGAAIGKPLKGHTSTVNSVVYSPDGRYITSGSGDYTIRIWDAETGAAVGKPLEGHISAVESVAYSPNGQHIISGSDDCTIRIWETGTGVAVEKRLDDLMRSWTLEELLRSLASSPDGGHTVSGSYDNATHVSETFPHDTVQPSFCTPMRDGFRAKPDLDGWVRESGGGLLYWVPHDCRIGFQSPALLTIPITSRTRSTSLDFDDFAFGTSWTQIFKSTPF